MTRIAVVRCGTREIMVGEEKSRIKKSRVIFRVHVLIWLGTCVDSGGDVGEVFWGILNTCGGKL